MSKVAIEKVDGKKAGGSSVLDDLKALSERIGHRAFELFQHRGGGDGRAMEDWFNAERDLLRIPEAEFVEHDGEFKLQINAPGFDAGDIHVTALPDALIVKGTSTHEHDATEGNVHFCEFDRKTLFRRFDLPKAIDPDGVTADLDKGVLRLTARKQEREPEKGESIAS